MLVAFCASCGSSDTSSNSIAISNSTVSRANDIVMAYKGYLAKHRISVGAIAVSFDKQLVASSGVKREATKAAPVASLSKAITAICTVKALEDAGVDIDSTLLQVLPRLMMGSKIKDARMKQITVAQLLTHNSGLHTAHLSAMGSSVTTMRKVQSTWQFNAIAKDGLAAKPGSGYHYANSNYLILGLVIERLTGEDYESWCFKKVLKPLSITTARLSRQWTILGAYGGWEISAADYLHFVNAYYSPSGIFGKKPETFGALAALGGGAFYGLGTYVRDTSKGYVFWHAGSFTWKSDYQSGKFGAYFASYANGFAVSVNLGTDLSGARHQELDSVLYNAAH